MLVAAAPVVWFLYGFDVGPVGPLIGADVAKEAGLSAERLATGVFSWPVPAPDYWHGLIKTMTRGHGADAFLLGKTSYTGWWIYYPICLLVKLPLGLLAALGFAAAGFALRRLPVGRGEILAGIWSVGLLAFFSSRDVDLGLRYLLPILPFLIALAGVLAADAPAGPRLRRGLLVLLVASQAAAVFAIRPDYTAFFNSIAGGPAGGRHWLSDANLDWGQDLVGLRELLDKEGIEEPYMAISANVNPEFYGIRYKYLPSPFYWRTPRPGDRDVCDPVQGWVVAGATNLSGVYQNPKDCYRWLERYRPQYIVGHSIYVFYVP
jgi:4-amino-4-deoxy-L-arabinose transferase-like glycosyltransferase